MRLLTINTGSSSLKAAVYRLDQGEHVEIAAHAERIGMAGSRLHILDAGGVPLLEQAQELRGHDQALDVLFSWLQGHLRDGQLDGIGHRVVYGGARYRDPQLIGPDLIATLQRLVALDPDHLPQALAAVHAARRSYPTVSQVACFDTAFHRAMPPVAQRYAIPRKFWNEGVIRYGFHGLSCEYVMQELRATDGPAGGGRVIIAHLGSGASMTAVRDGVGVETTMGFTPTGGLVMGTRPGDLDPGVLIYLLAVRGLSPEALSELVNRQSGLLGVSGISAAMRDLLERESSEPQAAEAIDLFCYQARKFLGALAAVLGGLDLLVFTGGIGERAASIRQRICDGLEFLGVELDPARNAAHAPIISRDGSRATVRVIQTDEDLMIARHTSRVVSKGGVNVRI